MNTAKIIATTEPFIRNENGDRMHEQEFIAYCARVSNPSNQMNSETSDKLLRYCIRNKHWSIFEMVNVVMQVDTTRDIARQILRHRSFSFQEFSQRYADPTKDMGFVTREARLQDTKNRQNSIETDNDDLNKWWEEKLRTVEFISKATYNQAIDKGIAKEQARVVLPEGLTASRLYMNGTLRSWIHYCELRCSNGTQKEHREVAISARNELIENFPFLGEIFKD